MSTLVRYGCVLIPHLPIRLALRRHPSLAGSPVAIATAGRNGTLLDCSLEARTLGLRRGTLAREAQNLYPQLTILPADPLAYTAAHAALLDALSGVCPALQSGSTGRVYLDLQGLPRHYPNMESLGAALRDVVDRDLEPRIGIAASTFVAFVAARRSRPDRVAIVQVEESAQMIARCPVGLLPVSPETRRRMEGLGLRRLGDIVRLPLASLVAQFGKDGQRAWRLAHGEDAVPFVAEPLPVPIIEVLQLPAASNLETDLAAACRIIASRLLARSELRRRWRMIPSLPSSAGDRCPLRPTTIGSIGPAVHASVGRRYRPVITVRLFRLHGAVATDGRPCRWWEVGLRE